MYNVKDSNLSVTLHNYASSDIKCEWFVTVRRIVYKSDETHPAVQVRSNLAFMQITDTPLQVDV